MDVVLVEHQAGGSRHGGEGVVVVNEYTTVSRASRFKVPVGRGYGVIDIVSASRRDDRAQSQRSSGEGLATQGNYS